MRKEPRPSLSTIFFGRLVRVTTDRKNRAYAIWTGSVSHAPHLFNDELKRLGRKLGAKDFALAPIPPSKAPFVPLSAS